MPNINSYIEDLFKETKGNKQLQKKYKKGEKKSKKGEKKSKKGEKNLKRSKKCISKCKNISNKKSLKRLPARYSYYM